MDLQVSEDRFGKFATTGIYVRAKNPAGKWGSFDIADLDRDSLHTWLRSRGGDNLWAENCVLMLLGHEAVTYRAPESGATQ